MWIFFKLQDRRLKKKNKTKKKQEKKKEKKRQKFVISHWNFLWS